MKRLLVIVFAIALLIQCGCTQTASQYSDVSESKKVTSQTKDASPPVLTESRARSLAEQYVSANISQLERAARGYDNIVSISLVDIGSIDLKDTSYTKQYNSYQIRVFGTFWGKDRYGNSVGKYSFQWPLDVAYTTETTNWMYLNWSSYGPAISRK